MLFKNKIIYVTLKITEASKDIINLLKYINWINNFNYTKLASQLAIYIYIYKLKIQNSWN